MSLNATEPLDKAGSKQKFHIIINLRAGSALGLSRHEVEQTVASQFAAAGFHPVIESVMPGDVDTAVARAAASNADVLIVGGGDGTVRTAARHIMGTSKTLGILPLGTMNRLAKDLEIPLSLEAAARFLATEAVTRHIDVATVNGEIFLCNSIMGETLRFSVGRARLRGRPVTERIPKYFAIFRDILSSRRKLSIVVDNGDERIRIRALSIIVTNNGYDETNSWFRRPRLTGGKLTMYISKHRSGLGMVMALARALIGLWRGDPEVMKLSGSQFVIYSKKRKRLSNDGELSKFDTPLRYEVRPKALNILMKAEI